MNRHSLSRVLSLTAAIAVAGLVGFHIALLWQRIADATIADPAVLLRWVFSALLVAMAYAARRYTTQHWSSRKTGFVFWLLVLLLHATIPSDERVVTGEDIAALIAHAGLAAASIYGLFLTPGTLLSLRRIYSSPHSTGELLPQRFASPSAPRGPPAR